MISPKKINPYITKACNTPADFLFPLATFLWSITSLNTRKILFGRSLTGVYILGFRIGELMIASAVLVAIIFLVFIKKDNNYGSVGSKIFLLKWGISIKFFKKFYLKSDSQYIEPLKEPTKNIFFYIALFKCKINLLYLKLFHQNL